ncbi:CpsB/CapC family capsule biosynthesis tyrosine phosphatase [Acidithiobacillus sp.]|jgi:tyrosine-protein phosphatase YwqE|uniref:tyrosine-protein phosphatase n=1 Tax=Acidithiobacillus sp. TaxID=1872118 RepID=UPI0025BEA4B0|nr:CpsB/CapC family capsule biosynthesis tyrosine phosphatase [Acidithiobacillus sp.]MCK9187954.1 protein tyrosine phosphatase [Acidithiobacillus sp.]MCK9359913.1 protein tyrosine phosphatase [Acidithiobacillus sp.]
MRALRRFWPTASPAASLREPAAATWDFHCHLLPAVDDGLRSLEETQAAIESMRALGYRGAVLTPHIYPGVYDNTPEQLREAFHTLQQSVGSGFSLHLAAEYFVDETIFDAIARDNLLYLAVGKRKLVLVEFPALMLAPRGMDVLVTLSNAGYQPVLAHVERYRYIQFGRSEWLPKIEQSGAWLQCDIGSLVGQYGPHPQAFARWLLDHELPTLWGTDLHRTAQLERYIAPGLALLVKSGQGINTVLEELAA